MKVTTVFESNITAFNKKIRRIVNKGGTSSSKTFSILQLLKLIAERRGEKHGVVISVVSETMPHLRRGAIKDFDTILKLDDQYNENNIDLSNRVYYFGKSYVEFFSVDTIGKATGLRRDILYLNECNHIPYKIVQELEQRTNETIFYDYNPTEPFWIDDKVFTLPEREFIVIKSNYRNNNYLEPSIAREIELKASIDPNFKRTHIDVEYGVYEGIIFPDITLVDEMPPVARKLGMDFGFTNDPTTLIDVRFANSWLWLDQLLWEKAMTNNDIIQALKALSITRKEEIIADSAEPKSIKDIELAGFNIKGAAKGKDSIRAGIDRMKSFKIMVTKRSHDLIKEFRNYRWAVDRNGEIDKRDGKAYPVDMWNHGIDPTRYVVDEVTKAPLTPPRYSFNRR